MVGSQRRYHLLVGCCLALRSVGLAGVGRPQSGLGVGEGES